MVDAGADAVGGGEGFEIDAEAAVPIPGDGAVLEGEFAEEALFAGDFAGVVVPVAELAFHDAEDGDIGNGVDGEVAEFGVFDELGGGGGGGADGLGEGEAEGHEFGHEGGEVHEGAVHGAGMEVGRDGIGEEAVFDGAGGIAEDEAAAAMADVELDAAFACVEEVGVEFAVFVDVGNGAAEHVGGDVAGAEVFVDEFVVGALGEEIAEVDHDRDIGFGAGGNGGVNGFPIGGLVVGGFDADDDILVFGGEFGDGVGVEVVLFGGVGDHAEAGDVEHGEDAGAGAVDDGGAEDFEVAPAGGAGIDHGGDAGAEGEGIGLDGVIAGPGAGIAGGEEDVDVEVDEAGGDEEAGDVDGFPGAGGGDGGFDGGNPAGADSDVEAAVAVVAGVDEAAAAEEEVEVLGGCGGGGEQEDEQSQRHGGIVSGKGDELR